jgi:hypothetical protein
MARELIVSPMGSLMWPALFRPRLLNRGKPDEKQAWEIKLLLETADADAQFFVKQLKGIFTQCHGAAARPGKNGLPFSRYIDANGDETDLWVFKFAKNVVTSRGTPLSPPVVTDAQGNPWPEALAIGNGSAGKVAFGTYSWDSSEGGKGLSLELEAVRIIGFQEYIPAAATAAFGDPEPGFVLPPDLLGGTGVPAGTGADGFGGSASKEEIPW